MSWEHSITLAYVGAAIVVAYIGSCIKDDEKAVRWLSYFPMGIRTFLYLVSFGLVMFPVGMQQAVLYENGVYVNQTAIDSSSMIYGGLTGGIKLMTITFTALIVFFVIFFMLMIIEGLLLKKRKNKEKEEDYDAEYKN